VLKDKIIVSEALVACFICQDTNNSGTLTASELMKFIDTVYDGRAIESNVKRLFQTIDIDGDD
jgi:Ca2+-binding EF-hand superfamily protein